jgi:hypothetical protein
MLDILARKGHVVMPRIKISAEEPPKFSFVEVGQNKATTFTGLCAKHDRLLFSAVERQPIDLSSTEHLFLLAYRAVLKEAHATRKSALDIQCIFQEGAGKGLWPGNEPTPAGMLAVEQMMSAHMVDDVKRQFDEAFLKQDWERVRHKIALLEVEPNLAVNAMFSTGVYSEILQAPAFVTLNVFPARPKLAVIFSYLHENHPQAFEALGHVWELSGYCQQYELSKLILGKCENLVLSPRLYEAFTAQQKAAILQYFERNTFGASFETEDGNLLLFKPLPFGGPKIAGAD